MYCARTRIFYKIYRIRILNITMIDTHCHLDFYKDEELGEIINSSEFFKIDKIINPSSHFDSNFRSQKLSEKYNNVYFAVGLHPEDINNLNDESINKIEVLVNDKKCVAIGEIGLDYHYFEDENVRAQSIAPQKDLFIKQLDLAAKYDKPVIIHTRDAGEDVLDILNNYKNLKFVVHCFSENIEFAKKVIDMGGMISFTGLITFKNVDKKILDVISSVSIDKIMIETDGPYLTPQQFRGQLNKPEYVGFVAEKIAEIKNMSLKEVEHITTVNANKFFNL